MVPDYQAGGQDFTAAWDSATGQLRPGFPAQQNDLAFLTGPSVADIDGLPGEEVVAATASLDLQAFNAAGQPASSGWPKLTGDWTVATPLIGSFGDGTHKTVVNLTRWAACSPTTPSAPVVLARRRRRASTTTPRTRATTARDAVARARRPTRGSPPGLLTLKAPGDDLLCGTADHYELLGASGWTTSPVKPSAAGTRQTIPVDRAGALA